MQKTADEMRMRDLIADVCASDLVSRASMNRMFANAGEPSDVISCHSANPPNRAMKLAIQPISATINSFKTCRRRRKIGRASCRARVCQYELISVDAVSLTKNTVVNNGSSQYE